MTKFDNTRPSILQLSSSTEVFLIDLISLCNNQVLDSILSNVFSNSTIIGFCFRSDLQMWGKFLPKMQFYKTIERFVDAQEQYGNNKSLSFVIKEMIGNGLCKRQQMSNWEKRPLTQAQMHYAALDGWILVEIA